MEKLLFRILYFIVVTEIQILIIFTQKVQSRYTGLFGINFSIQGYNVKNLGILETSKFYNTRAGLRKM